MPIFTGCWIACPTMLGVQMNANIWRQWCGWGQCICKESSLKLCHKNIAFILDAAERLPPPCCRCRGCQRFMVPVLGGHEADDVSWRDAALLVSPSFLLPDGIFIFTAGGLSPPKVQLAPWKCQAQQNNAATKNRGTILLFIWGQSELIMVQNCIS